MPLFKNIINVLKKKIFFPCKNFHIIYHCFQLISKIKLRQSIAITQTHAGFQESLNVYAVYLRQTMSSLQGFL